MVKTDLIHEETMEAVDLSHAKTREITAVTHRKTRDRTNLTHESGATDTCRIGSCIFLAILSRDQVSYLRISETD